MIYSFINTYVYVYNLIILLKIPYTSYPLPQNWAIMMLYTRVILVEYMLSNSVVFPYAYIIRTFRQYCAIVI